MNLKTRSGLAIIGSGQTVSSPLSLGRSVQAGIVLPPAFTGVAVTFQVSTDGASYVPLYDGTNALVSMTVTQGRAYVLPATLLAWPQFKLVSGTAEAATRSISLVGV